MRTLEIVQGKMFDRRVDWERIDRRKARKNLRVLDLVREACLIESYLPVYTGKMLRLFWDDLDATAIFTIESIEAYGHYYLLRRYLETVGYRPITDREVIALRDGERRAVYADQIRELVNFMGTEHFAAAFFSDLVPLTEEPVLAALLPSFAEEEAVHAQFASDLLAKRLERDPGVRERLIRHARSFHHVGTYVMPSVSPATSDTVGTIAAFNRRFERLLGEPLSDLLVGGGPR